MRRSYRIGGPVAKKVLESDNMLIYRNLMASSIIYSTLFFLGFIASVFYFILYLNGSSFFIMVFLLVLSLILLFKMEKKTWMFDKRSERFFLSSTKLLTRHKYSKSYLFEDIEAVYADQEVKETFDTEGNRITYYYYVFMIADGEKVLLFSTIREDESITLAAEISDFLNVPSNEPGTVDTTLPYHLLH